MPRFSILLVWTLVLAGCATVDEFALPTGNADAGRLAFISLGCTTCHSAAGAAYTGSDGGIHFPLGSARYETSYIELVTSVINPSHRISYNANASGDLAQGDESRMPVFNDILTVRQLTDIVTYLAPQYEMIELPYYDYTDFEFDHARGRYPGPLR